MLKPWPAASPRLARRVAEKISSIYPRVVFLQRGAALCGTPTSLVYGMRLVFFSAASTVVRFARLKSFVRSTGPRLSDSRQTLA
ncbi:hypothetical protein BURKHO8Y_210002 [Burkholderia sp. 8Y]|nr:hypothetical protein BURKHO8Y_210002 [Burkholderia sp. 8Y]